MYIDSHCHLTDRAFEGDRAGAVARARAAGVVGVVSICSDAADLVDIVRLVGEHPEVWGTAGVHPHEAGRGSAEAFERLRHALRSEPRLRAIGECGLDFHYDHAPRDVQRAVFRTQLELATELSLPVVVHAREADADVAHMIREYQGRVIGVLHCFSGGRELLEVGLDAEWYISFAGIVTFPSFRGHGLLRAVPRERLLVETDSPFLAPVPHRGKRNEPGYVVRVAEAVARLRGEPIDEVAAYTSANARRLFGI